MILFAFFGQIKKRERGITFLFFYKLCLRKYRVDNKKNNNISQYHGASVRGVL